MEEAQKEAKEAPDAYSKNVYVFTAGTPLSIGDQDIGKSNTVYIPNPTKHIVLPKHDVVAVSAGAGLSVKGREFTKPGMRHRSWLLCDELASDPASTERRATPHAVLTFRLPPPPAAASDDHLAQIAMGGIRLTVDGEALDAWARFWPVKNSPLESILDGTGPIQEVSLLPAFSRRLLAFAWADPRNVVLRSSLRGFFRGVLSGGRNTGEKEKTLGKNLELVLKQCGGQISLGLDQDSKGHEVLLLVTAKTKNLDGLFLASGTRQVSLEGLKQEALEETDYKNWHVEGVGLMYGELKVQLLLARSDKTVLVALGGEPRQAVEEAIDRLLGGRKDDAFEADRLRAPARASFGLVVWPRAFSANSRRTDKRDDSLVLWGLQGGGSANFHLRLPSRGVNDLCGVLEQYKTGDRKGSWLGTAMRQLSVALNVDLKKEGPKPGEGKPPAAAAPARMPPRPRSGLLKELAPLASAITLDSTLASDETCRKALACYDDLRTHAKVPEEELVLAQAVKDLTAKRGDAAMAVLKQLQPARLRWAKDPDVPEWAEALADLLISQAVYLEKKATDASPYAEGGLAILLQDYGVEERDPGNAPDDLMQLAIALMAWKTQLYYKMNNEDEGLRSAARALLAKGPFGEGLGKRVAQELSERLRKL